MSYIKVSIINNHTLKLEEDGLKGSLIDLKAITSIDTEIILNKIKEATDLVYAEELNKVKVTIINEQKLHQEILEKGFLSEIEKLNNLLKTKESEVKTLLELEQQKTINEYQNKINNLNNEHQVKISELENQIKLLTQTIQSQLTEQKLLHESEVTNLKYENEKIVNSLELEIDNLKRERSSHNVKMIGENLERWCDTTFKESYNLIQPENIKWYKDNVSVDGTKGDFIYEVYATEQELENVLLTSALLEMKSEDPNAKHKQNLNTILKKLDSDRNKKNLEYAILVSEIDFNNNDLYIERVYEYPKMYIVRPQYFMTLLNIITAFALKYEHLLLAKAKEAIKFKDIDEILLEFENMKADIIDNQLRHINTKLDEIKTQNERIVKASEEISKALDVIVDSHLNALINKINNFNINRIVNKIKKVS